MRAVGGGMSWLGNQRWAVSAYEGDGGLKRSGVWLEVWLAGEWV